MQQERLGGTWAVVLRAAALAALVFGITALGACLLETNLSSGAFLWQNQVKLDARLFLVKCVFGSALAAGAAVISLGLGLQHRVEELPELLWRFARACSPIAPLSCIPLLMRWQLWKDNDLIFLVLVLAVALALKAAVAAAIEAQPLALLGFRSGKSECTYGQCAAVFTRAPAWVWWAIVLGAVVAYCCWFSYYTVVFHRSGRSGWDLSIEDSIFWNNQQGGHFLNAPPALGPTGSHFARHSALVAYLLVPFYAFYQASESVLVLQTLWMGTAAIPLFLLGRGRLGAPLAALIAVLYLMHPAVQESNLFEMHYIKLGTLPFWTTLWLLDTKRFNAALGAAAVTLMVREDVATWIVLLGAFGIAARMHLKTSVTLLLGGLVYVGLVKFVVMPSFVHGRDELMFMYQDFLPPGKGTFGWAMVSALTNPAYLLKTLLEPGKLIYVLQILIPLLFIPLRRPIGWLAVIPGFVFSLMSTRYSALVDIHFQYSPHLLAWFYPVLIVVLGQEMARARSMERAGGPAGAAAPSPAAHAWSKFSGSVAGMTLATLLCSSQFGAVIQQNTSRGGPIPYHFGWDDEGRVRGQAIVELLAILPPEASVAASAFTITHVSNRPAGYSLSIDLYDAEYIMATTNRGELVPDEYTRLKQVFENGSYGVVAIRRPFFLMRRGHSTEQNDTVRNAIR